MSAKIPQAAAKDLIPLLVADIYELAGAFRESGEAIAQTVGQTQARWQVLSAASTGDLTVPQIARRLGYARQSVQRVLDLLVEDGVVEVAGNPDHKRSPLVRLTRKGEGQLAQLSTAADESHRRLAQGLKRKKLETALTVLRGLRDALREESKP